MVATPDTLASKMAGPGIRAWHVAAALAAEHDVELVSTSRCDLQDARFRTRTATDDDLRELERWCDVLILQGWVMSGRPYLRLSDKVIVVDIYDPIHLELLEPGREEVGSRHRRVVRAATSVLNEQLLRGDFFMCASEKQRDFWLGHLASLGRVNPATYDEDSTLRSLVTVVPFGVADDPPVRTSPAIKGVVPGIGAQDRVILWGGGIYNWLDPLTLIQAINRLRLRQPDVRLFFLGLAHPSAGSAEMGMARAARALSDDLGLTGSHIFFNDGWVAYQDRQNFLLDADIGVSTHLDHVETAFSFRTRILDYLWAGLPTVATRGDALAQLIEDRDLGLTVPPGDVGALQAALGRLLQEDDLAATCRANIVDLVPELVWAQGLRPLLDFCRAPRRAPDLVDPDLATMLGGDPTLLPDEHLGWRHDLTVGMAHLREGGLPLVADKALGRLRRRLRSARDA